MLIAGATSFSCYIPNKTRSKFTRRCYLFLTVSSFPFCNSTYLPIYLPTYLPTYLSIYLSIYRFVKVASRFSLLNHRIPSIACLLLETFLRASEFSKTKCIVSGLRVFRAFLSPPLLSVSPFVFRISRIELTRKVIVKRVRV